MLSKVTIAIALLAACLAVVLANEEDSEAFRGAEKHQLAVETEITSPRAELAPHRTDADKPASPSATDPESGADETNHAASKTPPLPAGSDQEASNDHAHATSPAQCQSKIAELQAIIAENKSKMAEKDLKMADKDRKNAELQAAYAAAMRKIAERSQQLQATKELGDEAGLYNTGAGEDHLIYQVERAFADCANAANCNPAKCYGGTQDNRVLHGDLDCETTPESMNDEERGSACLDNLSGGAFYVSKLNGEGKCVDFQSDSAFSRKTIYDYSGGVRNGTISKVFSGHPHRTPETIGAISAKRMKCEGDTCHVYKVGYCIKCPRDVFRSKKEQEATQDDITKFYSCCIMGRTGYNKEDGTREACHRDFRTTGVTDPVRPPGAFTATNDASAALKPEYVCDAEAQAAADAMMKAS